jgi:hypothetical protein
MVSGEKRTHSGCTVQTASNSIICSTILLFVFLFAVFGARLVVEIERLSFLDRRR